MKRNEGESFEDYKKRRRAEQVVDKIILAGKIIVPAKPINRKMRRLDERFKNRG